MHQVGIAILSTFLSLTGLAVPAENADNLVFTDFDAIANHYKCYEVQPLLSTQFPNVILSDQFKQSQARVIRPRYLCNPTKKNNTGIVDYDLHYVCFNIIQNVDPALPRVRTSNQFGSQILQPIQSELLCLPSKKEHI